MSRFVREETDKQGRLGAFQSWEASMVSPEPDTPCPEG